MTNNSQMADFIDIDNNIRLFFNDCLVAMKAFENNSIDFILCDLPYGITKSKWDIKLPFNELWDLYKKIIKPNGCIALFASGLFYIDLVNSNREMFKYDLVWDKILISGFLNANKMPLRRHEQIAIFYKKPPVYNPQFFEDKTKPLHSTGIKAPIKYCKGIYNNHILIEDKNAGSCIKYPTSIVTYQKAHPSKMLVSTQKPVKLCEYLIKTYSNEGDIVLDNCMGSGTTGIACIKTKRKFIGIESNSTHYKIAKERIKQACISKKL